MKNIALIFPGQGAQYVGMGEDFYQSSPDAKRVFDLTAEIIQHDFLNVVFKGPEETLRLTAFSQPAIVTTSLAALAALRADPKFQGAAVKFMAGLSLGEYSAVAASGALPLEETIRLIQKRARFMEEATKLNAGKMAAIIGLDAGKIREICEETGAEVANFNSPQQIVITGDALKVEQAAERLKAAGAKTVVFLEVSGAFHSSLMSSAADKLREALPLAPFRDADVPVVSNVDAQPVTDAVSMRKKLADQVTSSVRWVDTVQFMIQAGVRDFIEIGPGKVLKGLIRRIDSSVNVMNIEKYADIASLPLG